MGTNDEAAYVEVARERIDSALPLDESAMTMMTESRSAPRVAFGALGESGMGPTGTALTDAKRRWTAAVRADGSIACDSHAGSIHKVGAALPCAPSANATLLWPRAES